MGGRLLATDGTLALGSDNIGTNVTSVGGYLAAMWTGATSGGLAPGANTLAVMPIWIPKTMSFDRISVEVVNASASTVIRLSIWRTSEEYPTTPLLDAGTVDSSSTGFKEITINQQLTRGIWYLGASCASGVPTIRGGTSWGILNPYISGVIAAPKIAMQHTGLTGDALPASFTLSPTLNQFAYQMYLRRSF